MIVNRINLRLKLILNKKEYLKKIQSNNSKLWTIIIVNISSGNILKIKLKKICFIKYINIARSLSCYGFQKVGYTAENCKWYNLNPDLGVTPRFLFLIFRILFS